MILINDEPVTIREIRSYKGQLEVYAMLNKALDRIDELGWPIKIKFKPGTFKVNPKSGLREGKKMIMFQRFESVKTKQGSFMVRWADGNTIDAKGTRNYGNPNYTFRKTRILNEDDIEEALFLIGVSPLLKSGALVVEDLHAEAREIADRRAYDADVSYLIYGRTSPLTDEKLIQLAYAWGVSGIESMRDNILGIKNKLFDAVKAKEAEKDPLFGYEAFLDAASTDETPEFLECMEIINKSILAKAIAWDGRNFQWLIKGSTKEDDVLLMTVNPADSKYRKEKLAQFLAADEKKKALLAEVQAPRKETEQDVIKSYAAFTDAQWKKLPEKEMEKVRKMANVPEDAPPAVAIRLLKDFFKKAQ